jgi:predicted alpha/beta-hydrolase family hydrolase
VALLNFLIDSPKQCGDGKPAAITLVLAHGAGAPMDTDFMNAFAQGLAEKGRRVVRFEFAYMAARRSGGSKKPPSRAPQLLTEWHAVLRELRQDDPGARLAIGGKSLGGRMASLIADDSGVAGLVCLGYPFHPPGRPERLRTDHLRDLKTPTLIVQGDRDPFGSREEVGAYSLSPAIGIHWIDDGDHSLTPRKRSGRDAAAAWAEAVEAIDAFLAGLT